MKTPHIHADLIKAWADGAEIEYFTLKQWFTTAIPKWEEDTQYRIKPDPQPDVVRWFYASTLAGHDTYFEGANIKLTFDGETGKFIKAEVL